MGMRSRIILNFITDDLMKVFWNRYTKNFQNYVDVVEFPFIRVARI